MENPGPSNAEWERHKDMIRRLYVEEDVPIARLMEIMEKEHGFRARYGFFSLTSSFFKKCLYEPAL